LGDIQTKDYKVSVIIPTYNSEKFIKRAVDSVINQTLGFDNIELIIVDDNSNDRTQDILKEFSKEHENIRTTFLKENTGSPSKPRNIGIMNSTSDHIMFLDQDDAYYPETCEKMYSEAILHDADLVICRPLIYHNFETKKGISFLDDYANKIIINSIQEFPGLMRYGFTTLIWNKIFRRSMIINKNVKFPERALYEDVYFSVKSYFYSKNIVLLNDFYGYVYNINDSSTSTIYLKKNLIKQFHGLMKIFLFLEDKPGFETIQCEILAGWFRLFLFTNLDKKTQINLLKQLKPFLNKYSIFVRLNTVSLPINVLINITMKIFSININIPIYIHKIPITSLILKILSYRRSF
jgi:glycosyltransferase involved in cell wall biosynthesis